ncbi:MAG: radical SAM protein [Candidatus Limivivens sp.]|nr:radical SAM protein [Candidatus Limivivens sp.]
MSADFLNNSYQSCRLCPRQCGVNRQAGQKGFCRMDARIFGARAALHMWEEPCISGTTGSGTVFFSGCTLGCIYCQNYEIARAQTGKEITTKRLAEIFLELQEKHAANINLVTPTHYAPSILEALKLARGQGLTIPTVYNCSGYESVEALRMLEGWIDIYLTDFKYMESELAACCSRAWDYPQRAKEALAEMVRQTGEAMFDEDGMMKRGTIVRHLLLPGHVKNAREVLRYVYETYGNRVWISLMNQYTPVEKAERLKDFPELNRKVTKREYERLLDYAVELGVENGFLQEGETAKESFIPAFDYEGL